VAGNGTNTGEKVDGRFERSGKEPSAVEVSVVSRLSVVALVQRILNRHAMNTYPVRNRLPILAPEKSKLDEGRRRLTISYATTFSIDRTSSFFAVEILLQRACSASMICCHSSRAKVRSLGSLWLKKVLMAAFSLSS